MQPMQLDAYLRQEIMAIGTSDWLGKRRRRRVVLGIVLLFGIAFIAAAYLLSDSLDRHGWRRPLDGFLSVGIIMALFALMGISFGRSFAERLRRRLRAKYAPLDGTHDPFADEAYAKAAEALRELRPLPYEGLEREYGEDVAAILALTGCIDVVKKGTAWQRVVSIRSIEEDRPADERDDEE